MIPNRKASPIEEVEFLVRSEHRITALLALAERPRSRDDLRALTGASASTISRMLREFEARNWLRRDGTLYELTQPGAVVASGARELLDSLEVERKVRDVWTWLPPDEDGFTVEMCEDAVVTVAETDNPYGPVNRFSELLRGTDEFRFVGFDVALLEPCRDQLHRQIVGGMETEIVDPPSVARYVLSTYRDHCAEPLESGSLTVLLHGELPEYGVSLFDDRVAISGYDVDSGTVKVLLDTSDPDARAWAESRFETYRREARPLGRELAH